MRYAKIPDIVHTNSFKNAHALKLLYYVTIMRDFQSNRMITTYYNLSMATKMTISAVRHALKQLERDGLVTIQTSRLYTIITIPNEEENRTTITDPLISLRRHHDAIERSLDVAPGSTNVYFDIFLQQQQLSGKKWIDEKDLVSHFCNWYLKNSARIQKQAKERDLQQQRQSEAEERRQQREAWKAEYEKRSAGAVTREEYERMVAEGKFKNI